MEWTTVSAQEALRHLKAGARAVDVRSSGEFERGAIPGFANLPILHDEHRHLVGLTYKEQGQAAAIALGLQLVLPLRQKLVADWRRELEEQPAANRLLICWRGGLRSQIAAEWLAQSGFAGTRVAGGYKALRGQLMREVEKPPNLMVLAGLTGSGKTELLQLLPPHNVVDLEKYARHRGSSFGLMLKERQPAQQTFENELGLHLFGDVRERVVEAESRLVGNCLIPPQFKAAMDSSPHIFMESSLEERVARIFKEYVEEPLRRHARSELHEHLMAALKRIERRLGGRRHQAIRHQLDLAFLSPEIKLDAHAPWIEYLLSEYYDPMYEFSNRSNEFLFRGNLRAVQDFLTHRFAGRRP